MAESINRHQQAEEAVFDLVCSVRSLSRGDSDEPLRDIVGRVKDFIRMIPIDNNKKISLEHLQIFVSFGACEALISLFTDPPIKGYKEIGEESVRLFLYPEIRRLPRLIQNQCASIVSEFASLLGIARAVHDPLYISCRDTIGYLLKSMGFANRLRYFGYVHESYFIQDFYPFAEESKMNLQKDLFSIMESSSLSGSLKLSIESKLRQFALFSLHLCRAIENHFRLKGQSLPLCLEENFESHPCYESEIKDFYDTFDSLLGSINVCMTTLLLKVGFAEGVWEFNHGWFYYLDVLKELNNFSKLYQGAEEKLSSTMQSFQYPLQMLVVHSKRTDDHQWLLKYKNVIDFKSRRRLIEYMFPEVKDDNDKVQKMLIDRSQLLTESFELIARADQKSLRNGISMEFANEVATGHGVLREWLFLVCHALFSTQKSLFLACPLDRRRFFPNPVKMDAYQLDYFRFSGQVIALALMHKVQVGIAFDRVFFLQLAGEKISLEDVRHADPFLYRSCKNILEMDADFMDSDAMGLTFVNEIEELGSRKVVELCPGGNTIIVNSKNREEYVHLLIQHRFVKSISKKVAYFARGFADILRESRLQKIFFRSLEHEDLDLMLLGSDEAICVKDWRAHTDYDDYKETDEQICWFWKVVEGLSSEQRRVLLFFWTSVKYLPINGFSGLPYRLCIYKTLGSQYHLPSSRTCFYRLALPHYPSLAVMQQHLWFICQEHVGSSFGCT